MKKLMIAALLGLVSGGIQAFAAPEVSAEKEWTFLVFLNGNNNLDRFGSLNINQMEQVGSNEKVNIVVQWASLKNKGVKRLYVTKDNDTNKVNSQVVEDMGAVDMGSYRNLVDFVKWGVKNYPAKHYFIDLWDHGSGWHRMKLSKSAGGEMSPLDISWDDNTNNKITTEQMGLAMREISGYIGRKIDVVASDACMMAMVEVADEMSDSVSVMAGSQDNEPAAGWPYDQFFARWMREGKMDGASVTTYLTEEYMKSYTGGSNGNSDVTFSSMNLEKMEQLHEAIKTLGNMILQAGPANFERIRSIAKDSQNFYYSDYVDMGDFVDQMIKRNGIANQKAGLEQIKQQIDSFVIIGKGTGDFSRATGASFWLPTSSYSFNQYASRYSGLNFHKRTQWGSVLKELLKNSSSTLE